MKKILLSVIALVVLVISNKDIHSSQHTKYSDLSTREQHEYCSLKKQLGLYVISSNTPLTEEDALSFLQKFNSPIAKILIDNCYFIDAALEKASDEYDAGNIKQAIKMINNALTIDPLNAKLWFSRGFLEHDVENYTCAIESYSKALALVSPIPEPSGIIYYHRALSYYELEEIDAAKFDYWMAASYGNQDAKEALKFI